jgi:hypothetical protein
MFQSRFFYVLVAAAVLAVACVIVYFVIGPKVAPLDSTAEPSAPATHADLARKGNLDAIMALSNNSPGSWEDAQAYKWLVAAEDFGHKGATAKIADLLEISSLRYDDGNMLTGHMHYELALAYLTGGDDLPLDLAKARKNLALSLEGIQNIELDFASDRKKLSGDALRVFDELIPAGWWTAKGR